MNAADFIKKWTDYQGTEKSGAKSWFADLCSVLGQEEPGPDPEYTYEKGARILGAGHGWADAWKKGHFGWEFKSRGENLTKAYQQLRGYTEDLENPPLLVVSDFDTIQIHTNFTNAKHVVHTFPLSELAEPINLERLRALWEDPDRLKPEITIEEVTAAAANELGRLALQLRDRGVEPHRAAHFTVELLFCFFAEDIGLLPEKLFSQLLEYGSKNATGFNLQLRNLLETMRDGGDFNFLSIPRFNGGLFDEIVVEPLFEDEIKRLREIARLDWGKVEPAIFGTLFERSLDPSRRSQLGAHYTGVPDIERVVEPVVMTPLRRRWDEVRANADPIVAEWQTARTARKTAQANKLQAAFRKEIDTFLTELRAVTILDPACGSGNFLYVALRKLMDLEKEVITYAASEGMTRMFAEVSPRQVLGLEINEYAVEITRTVVWIGYLQWRIANGFGISDPVLQPLDTIKLQDALLDLRDPENPKEAEWPTADYIVGNPPFLGAKKMRAQLGDSYVDELHRVFAGRFPPFADLVVYFVEKSRRNIELLLASRAGLLATNSIRGGTNRPVLDRVKATGDIFMAWDDEPWILDGAAVRISIIGIDNGEEIYKHLNGVKVEAITSALTPGISLASASPLAMNAHLCFLGVQLSGPFDVGNSEALQMLSLPLNPNGRPNSDVIRPLINGIDVTRRPRDAWIVDFGVGTSEQDAALYEAPFDYVKTHVKPMREKSRSRLREDRWWLTLWPRPEMRSAVSELSRYIATPTVSKFRLFRWFAPEYLPNHALVVFAREDDYFFGVLHSRAHEVWSLRMGTWLGKGNDPRYTPTTCFETFPFPWPPGAEPADDPLVQAIAAAAKHLDDTRRRWLDPPDATEAELKKRTLTNLYNQRPTWLQNLHAALDRAVWDAYEWPEDELPAEVEEEMMLERLLALNLQRN